MKAFLPIAITDAILTSTTVVETAPAAYAGGTTYAANDTASVAGSAGLITVYKSLQSSNTGNTPASSPLWWQDIGDTYQVYSGAATYALGDRVIDTTNHLVYESLAAGNIGNALTDTSKWEAVGYTNKWAMFKYFRSTKTTVPVAVTFVITPGQRIDCIGFTGLQAASISITATSVTGGGTVYSDSITLKSRDVYGWWDWLYARFKYRRTTARFDLPPYRDLIITVVVTGDTDQDVTIGKWGMGRAVFLGTTEAGATPDRRSSSLIERNDYNDIKLTPRRTVPLNRHVLYAEPRYLSAIEEFRVLSDAEPVFWFGVAEDVDHDYADSLSMLGVARQFRPELLTNMVKTTLENEGI